MFSRCNFMMERQESSHGHRPRRAVRRIAPIGGTRPNKTAFVLSGGGSCGAVQVGMLRELTAFGIIPDLVVGTSVGAINGAFFAGWPTPQGIDQLDAIWRGLRRSDIFPLSLNSILRLVRRSTSLIDPAFVGRFITQHLPYSALESARIPIYVVATDIAAGEPVCLSSGSVVDAILASIAIPAILPPVHCNGRLLMDGGVTSNTPVKIALDLGATRIFVLPTATTFSDRRPPRTAIDFGLHAISLLLAQHHRENLDHYRKSADIHLLPAPNEISVSPFDFAHSGTLIDLASRGTRRWLADYGGSTPGVTASRTAPRRCSVVCPELQRNAALRKL